MYYKFKQASELDCAISHVASANASMEKSTSDEGTQSYDTSPDVTDEEFVPRNQTLSDSQDSFSHGPSEEVDNHGDIYTDYQTSKKKNKLSKKARRPANLWSKVRKPIQLRRAWKFSVPIDTD